MYDRFECVGDVRGLGPMLAIELVTDRETKEPDSALAVEVLEQARAGGLIVIRCGIYHNVVRLLAPLVTSDDDAREAIKILGQALDAALTNRARGTEDSHMSEIVFDGWIRSLDVAFVEDQDDATLQDLEQRQVDRRRSTH